MQPLTLMEPGRIQTNRMHQLDGGIPPITQTTRERGPAQLRQGVIPVVQKPAQRTELSPGIATNGQGVEVLPRQVLIAFTEQCPEEQKSRIPHGQEIVATLVHVLTIGLTFMTLYAFQSLMDYSNMSV